jgi:hypothetical protein
VYIFGRRVPIVLPILLLAVAIVGYRAGHGRASSASGEHLLTASTASVQISYPSSWERPAHPLSIPGLSLAREIALAPGGEGAHAGLIAGALSGREAGPLPRQFVETAGQPQDSVVVNLQEAQAYSFSWTRLAGFDAKLIVYVIPNPGGDPTALACYASAAFSGDMQTCQHVVAALALVGESQSYDLIPEPAYAHKLSAAITALDRQRAALRGEIGPGAALGAVQSQSARLAYWYARTATSLSALQPSLVTGQAQAALTGAILGARDAYTALANAAAATDPAGLATARAQVYAAEGGVNAALDSFALLGYER